MGSDLNIKIASITQSHIFQDLFWPKAHSIYDWKIRQPNMEKKTYENIFQLAIDINYSTKTRLIF